MKTAKWMATAVVLGSVALAPTLMANSVVLTQNPYSYKVGGEFTAVTSPDNFLGNYAPEATYNGGFETFCIETSVEFHPGTTYQYTLSDTDSQGRNLSLGTAFLYYEFSKGLLTGYDYSNASQRKTDAGVLQSALWWLQGNQSYSGYVSGGTGNPYYDLAVSTLGAGNIWNPNGGQYSVQILQMWDARENDYQNQLVCVSAPDGGLTAGMLGMALAGLCLVELKKRKPALAHIIRRTR